MVTINDFPLIQRNLNEYQLIVIDGNNKYNRLYVGGEYKDKKIYIRCSTLRDNNYHFDSIINIKAYMGLYKAYLSTFSKVDPFYI